MGLMQEESAGAGGAMPSAAAGAVDAAGFARAALGLLGGETGGSLGGLAALAAAFERAGLAAVFQSWVAPGPNRPVSAPELQRVLGAEVIARLAGAARADPARVAAALAEILPRVVDVLTPAGALPAGDGDPAALARRLLGR